MRTTFLDADRNIVEPSRAALVVVTVTDDAGQVLYETWDRVISTRPALDTAAALAEIRAESRRPDRSRGGTIGLVVALSGVALSSVSLATNMLVVGIAGIVLTVVGLVILVRARDTRS
jgi:hypothetical protein